MKANPKKQKKQDEGNQKQINAAVAKALKKKETEEKELIKDNDEIRDYLIQFMKQTSTLSSPQAPEASAVALAPKKLKTILRKATFPSSAMTAMKTSSDKSKVSLAERMKEMETSKAKKSKPKIKLLSDKVKAATKVNKKAVIEIADDKEE